MDPVRLLYLLQQFDANRITEAERAELTGILFTESRQDVVEVLHTNAATTSPVADLDRDLFQPLLDDILQRKIKVPIVKMGWVKWVAAAVLLFAVTGIWWFIQNRKSKTEIVQVPVNNIVAPSGSHATITLANGQQVYLDSVANGAVAMQGNSRLVKLADGQLAYEAVNAGGIKEMQFNTLMNPRGSKVIDMTLADGSRIWLNAGSSVTYPVAFIGNERKVTITGEAYFEVAHDAAKPFYVSKGGMEIKVLGTHFNVNAYDDEDDVRVTLLEGSVRVMLNAERLTPNAKGATLKPGEQAVVQRSALRVERSADLNQVMAWKNGFFNFNGADIKTMMKQLERWYDIQVQYEGNIPKRTFGGELSRDLNLSEILQTVSEMKIKFRMEGRTLIVNGN